MLDPLKIGRVRTTPAPRRDVLDVLPALARRATSTIRLHPRRLPDGQSLPRDASKIGGEFLWPSTEPWPICDEHEIPYVGVLQVRAEDAPEFRFKPGSNLFQLLWCPRDHRPGWAPYPRVFWRRREDAKSQQFIPEPQLESADDKHADRHYVPDPCRLFPERVLEYPGCDALSETQCQTLEEWDVASLRDQPFGVWDGLIFYGIELSVAHGTKLGGYVNWIQPPSIPTCGRGHKMQHLLTIASWEFDSGNWRRWAANEEQRKFKGNFKEIAHAAQHGAGLLLGDAGNFYVFVCRKCTKWPIAAILQCT